MFIIALIWLMINVSFLILSFYKIKRGKKETLEFIYPWGGFLGAFVYEDLLVFSIYWASLTLITILLGDLKYYLLGFLVFWTIRGLGETIYFMLEQFIRPNFHPHDLSHRLIFIRKIFGDISDQKCFVILQVFIQTIAIISSTLLIIVLLNWNNLSFSF